MPSIKITSSQWDAVDWTARDCEIARQLAVSRQRIGQVRRMIAANVPGKCKRNRVMDWSLSNGELAAMYGLHPVYVSYLRSKAVALRSNAPRTSPAATIVRDNIGKYVDGKNVRELAQALGVSTGTVYRVKKMMKC